MRLNKLFVFIFCIISLGANAQVKDSVVSVPLPVRTFIDTSIYITEAPAVKSAMLKVQEYERLTHGAFAGYRIQIQFGQDRNKAMQLKNEVAEKFPTLPTYLAYQQPYFKVSVGDFRTKQEAVRYLNAVKRAYPGAFVIKEKVNPPPLQ